jgi:hypothetical protein
LAALVVAIQQIDCHALGCRDPPTVVVELRLGRITEHACQNATSPAAM